MMSTHTMTGAVNLSSSRNNTLTTMAMSRPLGGGADTESKGSDIRKLRLDLTVISLCLPAGGSVCVPVCVVTDMRIQGHAEAKSSKIWMLISLALKPFRRSLMETEAETSWAGSLFTQRGRNTEAQREQRKVRVYKQTFLFMWSQDEKSATRFLCLLVLRQIKQDGLKRAVTPLHDTGSGSSTTPKNL